MALAFETTYGRPPASGFTKIPFASTSLGAEQPPLNSELLGYGSDPLAPIKDAVTADGDVVVLLGAEAFGFWLKAAFGAPTTTGTGPSTHEFQSGSWTLPSMSIETGMPDLPEEFGKWNSVFKRFRRWVRADVFYRIFRALAEDADFEYAMIDGSIVKAHRHG